MREIYLDNAATTRVFPEVIELMNKTMKEDYGNPSSKHIKGFEAEKYCDEAANIIADTMKVDKSEIIFTSGGTESNNMAIIGTALAKRRQGKHIITTEIEHAAVYKVMDFLESEGYEITYLKVDEKGHIDLEALRSAIREDTILVSIMYVNNEVGAVQDISSIGKLIKEVNPNTFFHTDAIQAYGKFKIRPKKDKIDLLSVSSHKIHGPKGVGFIYIDKDVRIRAIMHGGGQQNDLRSGTHNVPGIAGMAEAARIIYKDHDKYQKHLYDIKDYFIDRLGEIEGSHINSFKGELSAPQILSVSFDKIRAEVLLHALSDKGIYVSSGSACSSNHPGISGTLRAIAVKNELLDSTMRFSFGAFTEKEDVDETIDALKELLPILRRYIRR